MKHLLSCSAAVALLLTVLAPSLRAGVEEDLHAADTELNTVYQKALDALPNGEAKGRLREAQRAWIAYRDAELVLYGSMGANLRGVKITQTELTQDRTKRLRGIAQDARNGTVQ